jgi:hypothetical protein
MAAWVAGTILCRMQQIAVIVIVLGASLCFAMLAWAGQHRS